MGTTKGRSFKIGWIKQKIITATRQDTTIDKKKFEAQFCLQLNCSAKTFREILSQLARVDFIEIKGNEVIGKEIEV